MRLSYILKCLMKECALNHKFQQYFNLTNSEFTQLLKPHYNDAVNYCRALCAEQDQIETEEILQQSLLKAYENVDHLKNQKVFKNWLFQIITNLSLIHI